MRVRKSGRGLSIAGFLVLIAAQVAAGPKLLFASPSGQLRADASGVSETGTVSALFSSGAGQAAPGGDPDSSETHRQGSTHSCVLHSCAVTQEALAACTELTTPFDCIPNFSKNPTILAQVSGSWFSPGTWSLGRIPNATDVVSVGTGRVITIDGLGAAAKTVGIDNGGKLQFATSDNTSLTVGTLLVKPGGTLEAGTETAPILPQFKAEITIADQPIDTVNDPDRYGTGLIALGRVRLRGASKTPFVRLAAEPLTGNMALSLAQPVASWQPADRIGVPDTRQLNENERFANYVSQSETLTLATAQGTSLTLDAGPLYDHRGVRNFAGQLEYLPHVANLTRNVLVRSANPAGTRGHVLLTYRADVDVRYAEFRDLGRTRADPLDPVTNHIGRYALHLHHVYGPSVVPPNGYQFTLIGNSSWNTLGGRREKWGITVHDSHYGLVQDNVAYKIAGQGFVTEDGSESFNRFEHNFVFDVLGSDSPRSGNDDGSCFWLRGVNNSVIDNVAAAGFSTGQGIVAGSGYNIFLDAAESDLAIPAYPGADKTIADQSAPFNNGRAPIRQFRGNEAYGTATGLVLWNIGFGSVLDGTPAAESVIRDSVFWHAYEEGYFSYPVVRVTFDGYVVRGEPGRGAAGWESGDYHAQDVTIRNFDIRGVAGGFGGINLVGDILLENGTFQTDVGIYIQTKATPGSGGLGYPSTTTARNVRFLPAPGRPFATIQMVYESTYLYTNLIARDEVRVYAYNGVVGDDFQVFYREQRPDFVVPKTATRECCGGVIFTDLAGSPEAGLTNQQNWNRWEWRRNPATGLFDYRLAVGGDPAWSRVAIAGAIAPCATTRPEIVGFACGAAPPPPPPPTSFYTLTPCRLLDTRDPDGPFGGPAIAGGLTRSWLLINRCGIPPTARALSLNITVTEPTDPGNLRLFPGGTFAPPTSVINYRAGQTRANNGIAALGPDGTIQIRSDQAAGTVHVILDVNGYFQ